MDQEKAKKILSSIVEHISTLFPNAVSLLLQRGFNVHLSGPSLSLRWQLHPERQKI